ncbi:MAG TPA: GAF domain-containing protein [Bacteroidales bacterium]|nr:GAF domain-containing protein [Bacteroidales bacterium]HPR56843.1 GAF domain-containing protein [Bacteroidales bacterium]HRW96194.1 GAF domain-containing protein [Bacteroidales bacterium]
MESSKKDGRYRRIYEQLKKLLEATSNQDARMATVVAVLHHKMDYFFWTGFYCLDNGVLTVKTYQGPVACQVLKKDSGVCWAGINSNQTIVVPDVHKFPGHIACDARSKAEIVVPIRNTSDVVYGVLDVDSREINSFDETDVRWLEKIVTLL